jgi:hypothetical protein
MLRCNMMLVTYQTPCFAAAGAPQGFADSQTMHGLRAGGIWAKSNVFRLNLSILNLFKFKLTY